MLERIKEIAAESLGMTVEELREDASLKNDLGVDSLDLFEMVMALEEEFDMEIPTEELEGLDTLQDVASYVEAHKK